MKGESFFALMAGGVTGALLGLLFAPEKGEVTRGKIKKAASEGYDDFKEEAGELAHDAHVRARYARKEMNAIRKTLAEQGQGLKEEAREKVLDELSKLERILTKEEGPVDDQTQGEPTGSEA